MRSRHWIYLALFILLALCKSNDAAETIIDMVVPNRGSLNGETRITVIGKNFANNLFNFGEGNEHLGSRVDLVSGSTEYPCTLHKDGCHEKQITCYTHKMPEGEYSVRVTVDGVKVPVDKHCAGNDAKCKFKSTSANTPLISNIYPTSGKPGTMIRLIGKLISDRFGSNLALSSNGLEERLLRVYMGSRNCELKDLVKDEFFGLQLDLDGKSQFGHIDCKGSTRYIGNVNASFIVEGPYGRSMPDLSVLKVSSEGKIYMFQQFTSIDSVTPMEGSVEGGTLISLTGKDFDKTNADPKVMIDDTVCELKQELTDTLIVCETKAKPSAVKQIYKGNRGLKYEKWNATSLTASQLNEIPNLSKTAADYSTKTVDEANLTDTEHDNYVSMMSGFFVAPLDSDYRFYVKGDDNVHLYLSTDEDRTNMIKIAESGVAKTYFKTAGQQSEKKTLQKGKSYYMEILHREGTQTSTMQVAARAYTTTKTSSMTGQAWQEKQNISIRSTVRDETQILKVQSGGKKTATDCVQTVTVSGESSSVFRLGLHDVYTDPLTTSTSAEEMKAALEKLPSLWPSKVDVTLKATNEDFVYTLDFKTERGDLPEMTFKCEDPEFKVKVKKKVVGKPSFNFYNLGFNGIPSPDISVTATAEEVEKALTELFSVRCPEDVGIKGKSKFFQNFETSVHDRFGERVSDEEPFCGRYSAKNPTYLFLKPDPKKLGVRLSQYSKFCFAYRGSIKYVQFQFSFEKDKEQGTARSTFTVPEPTPEDLNKWHYHCEDIATIAAKKPQTSNHYIDWAKVYRQSVDLFVDTIQLAREKVKDIPGINYRRLQQARPNGAIVKTVKVTSTEIGTYTIVLTPHKCGYQFPLLTVEYGKVNSGSISSSSNSVDFSLSNGGTRLQVQITRDLATGTATPPVGGTFKITFDGKTTEAIPADADGDVVAAELRALPTIGEISVERTGDCANFDYLVTWLSQAGDLPKITFDSSLLTGNDVSVNVVTVVHGSLWFDPIMGDMLQTPHAKPQIRGYINNIPMSCSNDCSYDWKTSATPTIQSVDIAQGTLAQSTSIVITGTGFVDGSVVENKVVIGGVACTVTAATATTITCSVGNGPTGVHPIRVSVAGKGLASGSVSFTYVSAIQSISPTAGSIGGGTTLTITGFGFTADAKPKVNNIVCDLTTEPTPSEIICITPSSTSTSTLSVDVTVTQDSSSLTSPDQFSYDASSSYTAVITQLSTTTSSVEGGAALTITGSGFGPSTDLTKPVMIGGNVALVTDYSDTQVIVTLPSNPPGSYPVRLQIGTKGYADLNINSIPNIVYELKVTNIYPDVGSLYGGTKVTITGTGFSTNKILNVVKFGKHVCDVDTAAASKIVCTIADTGEVHAVTNTESHKVFGFGYGWRPASTEVKVGDYIQFSWTTPSWVSGIGFGIHQTMNASTNEHMPNGFSSGTAKPANGNYKYRFGVVGNYYYWSGFVDEFSTISLKGSVTVVTRPSHTQILSLTVAGHEAVYQTGGSDPSADPSCPGTLADISPCTDTLPATLDSNKFNFKFWACRTPVITNFDRTNGSTIDDIAVTGSGFSSTICNNEVTVGDAKGLVTSPSSTSFVFRIDPSTVPAIGVANEISVRVGNLGYALLAMKGDQVRRFALVPVVESISPLQGSKAGGTMVTIMGSGFAGTNDDIDFRVDGSRCEVKTKTYTKVVCLTPPAASPKEVNMTFGVFSKGSRIPAECKASKCKFTYSVNLSPTVSKVEPASVSTSPTSLSITGSHFGTDNSAVTVVIGGQTCALTNPATDSSISCDISNVPVGSHILQVFIAGMGLAVTDVNLQSDAIISSLSPTEGSIHGGLELKINGNGFVDGETTVTIDGAVCKVTSVLPSLVKCTTPPHAVGSVTVSVTSNAVTYPADNSFSYSTSATPTVTSINPTKGQAGDDLTITGTGFSLVKVDNMATVGGEACVVTAASATELTCTLGSLPTGLYSLKVVVAGSGATLEETDFQYDMTVSSYSPTTGSTSGGQTITILGSGFVADNSSVTVCGNTCEPKPGAAQSSSQYVCLVPPKTADSSCDVIMTVNKVSYPLSTQYTYDANLTPVITQVTPGRGGTGGGTAVTITGTGFGTTDSDVHVMIGDAECVVTPPVADDEIQCVTNPSKSLMTSVRVEIASNGIATQTNAAFEYVDVWSSPYTWGNQPPPADGDFVVVPKGQRLLLDTNTNVLKMLLIKGGEVIFDEKDVELKAENILIVDGGKLQVGTRESPFEHNAIITMYGNLRSIELPVYGAKTIAVRHGSLDLHGRVTPITWTRLASNAAAGSTTIVLQLEVNWLPGNKIIIATTSHRHSQKESEVHEIDSIDSDKVTLTLKSPLAYSHLGMSETYNNVVVDFRAEVGLLSHNVLVRGNNNTQWTTKIPACPAGFDTGEFATQTCFQGRFGDEVGSDEFGAMIMIHAPARDVHLATARLSYVEITHAGQAFRLGRYPVHFHLNGDMSDSYVIGCGIHHTFNRAVNVHGTHNTLVAHNVIYDIRGGAFFLEDGIETGNTFEYNLGVFVRASTSLLNDDITPATFWVTNPNNTIQHNAAAGGTHFGYWYRMHVHPDGPSTTTTICPRNVELGVFQNNTAHSMGWFGLWIFEFYHPMQGGSCSSTVPSAAKFQTLTAWNCDKGVEAVNVGALQFHNFNLINNDKAGYEGKLISNVPQYDPANSPLVKGGVIVGHALGDIDGDNDAYCSFAGIVFPFGFGMLVQDVHFENFDRPGCSVFRWTRVIGTCSQDCGGFLYKVSGLQFNNAPNKAIYEWKAEGLIEALDESLTGTADETILPKMEILPTADCTDAPEFSVGFPASKCVSSVRFHRFAFNDIEPVSLLAKSVLLENSHGETEFVFQDKHITHKPGWMTVLVDGQDYKMTFKDASQIHNISFSSAFYQFSSGQFVTLKQQVDKPDRFKVGGQVIEESVDGFNTLTDATGAWKYNDTAGAVKFLVSNNKREKRDAQFHDEDRRMNMEVFRCYYKNCTPPPDPRDIVSRPDDWFFWSDAAKWADLPLTRKPITDDTVIIPRQSWIVADEEFPRLEKLVINGGLEFQNDQNKELNLFVTYIYITGRLVIGWPDEPFLGVANIHLQGSHNTLAYDVDDGPTLGSKFIAVFGGLDLHGKDVETPWIPLASTALAGSNKIILLKAVDWQIGNEIVISTTSYNAWHTETFAITDNSGSTLTLNETLKYNHIVYSETLSGGADFKIAAEVGLLTRNIKIIGDDYDRLFEESFGARIVVARTSDDTQSFSGFAKIENVEFFHTGQEGYTASYDARFSLAYMDVSNADNRNSYVKKNAFHNGFSPAIGSFGVSDLIIENNVIHHTVGPGIIIKSDKNVLNLNLVLLSIWPGSYQDRRESSNILYEGGIEAMASTNIIMKFNVVAGSERAGIRYPGEPCDAESTLESNQVHGALTGVAIFPDDELVSKTCVKWSNLFVWKNLDWGMYLDSVSSMEIENFGSVENGVGLFTMVIGPSATSHASADNYIKLEKALFVGKTSTYDCVNDVKPANDDNIKLSASSRSWGNGTHGKVGVSMAVFSSGSNSPPKKPFKNIMAYQAIKGVMTMNNVTFARFKESCGDSVDYAITTNPSNADGNHPVKTTNIFFENMSDNYKLFYHIPDVSSINPSDCVDMDCDGLKKCLLRDEDGTFLGSKGAVIPVSEFQWGGDRRRGLGDFRIPKVMLADLDGTPLDPNVIAPHKGVIRNDQCIYREFWRGYECHGLNYEILTIESMDEDTETRRLSPVAILGEQYLDLINGPQDHGWCSGYTCRKRLSTFQALVATGKNYEIYFTSTTPQVLRLYMINAGSSESIRVGIWYARPNRMDVIVDGQYIMPKNGEMRNGRFFLNTAQSPTQYLPDVDTDPVGANYINRQTKQLFVIVKGQTVIELQTNEQILVSFSLPMMTVDDFFGANLIQNLAAFLNVDPRKVRIVNVVNEQSGSRRRKRSADTTTVTVEIGDEPGDSGSSSLTYSELQQLETQITLQAQTGSYDSIVNATVLGISMVQVVPAVSSSEWGQISVDDVPLSLTKAGQMTVHETPVPGKEGQTFPTAIRLRVFDTDGAVITNLGTTSQPWTVAVTLTKGSGSHDNATVTGTTTVSFSEGWANFTDLIITHAGSEYGLEFTVTSPTEAANFSMSVTNITVLGRQVTAYVASLMDDAVEDVAINISIGLKDYETEELISDIAWRGHSWAVEATLSNAETVLGSLTGTTSTSFDPATGLVVFDNLVFSEIGIYTLTFHIVSTPVYYDFTYNISIPIVSAASVGMPIEQVSVVEMKVEATYHPTNSHKDALLMVNTLYRENKNNQMKITSVSARPGSVIITIMMMGSVTGMNSTFYSMCSHISGGSSFTFGGSSIPLTPYLTVNGSTYYGPACGVVLFSESDGLHPGIIAAIVIICVLLIGIVTVFIIWKCYFYPKTKTFVTNPYNNKYIGTSDMRVEDFLFRDKTFMSIKSQSPSVNHAPADTLAVYNLSSMSLYDTYDDRPVSARSANKMPVPAE